MEAEIRKLSRKGGPDSDEDRPSKKPKKSHLEEEMSKYTKGRGAHKKGKRKDEGDVLAALSNFRSMLKSTSVAFDETDEQVNDGPEDKAGSDQAPPKPVTLEEDPGIEVDDDTGFLTHALHFPKDDTEVNKAERDYEVIDPRQPGARAREEEKERKKTRRPKDGGRGFRR